MPRGSKPGERRGGRRAGVPNKATAEIKAIARDYAPKAMKELARLATTAKSEQARVSAIKEILDRAYGKATQPLAGDRDAEPVQIEATPSDLAMALLSKLLPILTETNVPP